MWLGVAVAVALALVLVAPVWGGGPPAGEDVMAHLVRADFGISHLVNHGRLDGWFPRFVLGHQEFLFNGPGLTWLMALARGLTFGALSNTGALKVVGVASVVSIPPAMWFLARSFGLSRQASGFAAVVSLGVSNPYGPGLQGLYEVGLVSHQAAAPMFLVALGAALRCLTDPAGPAPGTGVAVRRWRDRRRAGTRHPQSMVAVTALSTAALAVTHLLSVLVLAVMLALALPALAAGRRLTRAGLRRLALAGAGAGGLAGFWLVPALAHRDLRGVVTTWGTPPILDRLEAIVEGDLLAPAGFAALAALGWFLGLTGPDRRGAFVWATLPLAYLAVAHGSLEVLGGNDVTLQLANRGMGYAALVAACGAGVAVDALTRWLQGREPRHLRRATRVLALAGLAAFVGFTAPGRGAAGQQEPPVPAMRATAELLARVVPDGARFATQRDFPGEIHRTGVIHPEIWLARNSGRNSLNGFNVESVSTPGAAFEPDELDDRVPAVSADRLARLGVTHVVTTGGDLSSQLAASGRFVVVWQEAPMTVFEVVGRPGQPPPAALVTSPGPIDGRVVRAQPERLTLEVDAVAARAVTVALAWSPKWHGRLDGRAVDLERTGDGLVRFRVPAGTHRLDLAYRGDVWDRVGPAVTGLTAVAGLAAARRRRRRQPMSRSFSRTA